MFLFAANILNALSSDPLLHRTIILDCCSPWRKVAIKGLVVAR